MPCLQVAFLEALALAGETHPFNLHYVMFLPTLQNQVVQGGSEVRR